jgi:3-isopropylmalate/(R)-2-methylmalate dehydratase small subunit
MEKFVTLSGIAALLLDPDIDTDAIIPAQFLRSPSFDLAKGLFFNKRVDQSGAIRKEFVLNQEPFTRACALVAGINFGCGSSREHAVWALRRFGIRCVVAPSFGEIFYENCFKNGVLPIVLGLSDHEKLASSIGKAAFELEINLDALTIRSGDVTIAFSVPAEKREALMQGLDEIGATLAVIADIRSFRKQDRRNRPWIYDLESSQVK